MKYYTLRLHIAKHLYWVLKNENISQIMKDLSTHRSEKPVNLNTINSIKVMCNIAQGSFNNHLQNHSIYEFFPSETLGSKVVQSPPNLIYYKLNKTNIDTITFQLVDQDHKPINNFRLIDDATKVKLINNGHSYLFEQIRLEINGIEVDSTRVLGITSSLKGYLSGTPDNYDCYENAGWNFKNAAQSENYKGEFSTCIPLKYWLDLLKLPELGTTKKVVWNLKTASKLEKPRFIIIGLQKGRKNLLTKDCSIFDHCNLTNVKSDDKDEFETVAKETLDKIIEILEQDEINNTGSELIDSVKLDNLVEELDTFDEEIFNDKVENKPISSDVLNKSLRLMNLEEFENSPTTSATRGSERKPLNAIDAIKLIPDYSGQTEIYPFLNVCEVIINTVDADQQPFMLIMIAATKLSNRAFNATRYKEIKIWEDMKKILLDAFNPLCSR
ncbi:hypothetical protein QTP88_001328 [Uroleucon formosanum]